MAKTVYLDASRIRDRNAMYMYFDEMFDLPEGTGRTIDSISDVLSEVSEDVSFILTHDCIREIVKSNYAFKVLLMLGRNADENPHITIHFAQ